MGGVCPPRGGARPDSSSLSSGVDDAESECGLDNFGTFDWVIENHGDEHHLEEQLRHLTEFVQRVIVES